MLVRRTTRGAILFMISEILFADRDSDWCGAAIGTGMIECVLWFMSHKAVKILNKKELQEERWGLKN